MKNLKALIVRICVVTGVIVSGCADNTNAEHQDAEVDVVDAEGVLVPQASNLIEFEIQGPGVLVGVDNGDAISHESYKGTSRSAFSGRVMAIVQSTGEPGRIVVNAASNGLVSAEVDITADEVDRRERREQMT